MPQTLRTLHVRRLKTHRLQPSRPLRDARAAAAFVRERRVVLPTARSSLPMLAEAIAGESIRGNWMAHPAVYRIYDVLRGLRKYDLVTAPLVLAKETLLAPSLGPAVERIAVDEERLAAVRANLPPVARRLLHQVEERGRLRMDQWPEPLTEARRARLLLMRQLLVFSREGHTEGGYHTAFVTPWTRSDFSRRFGPDAARLTLSAAVRQILLAAIRSAVLAPEREVRRWLVTGAEGIDALVAEGKVRRLTGEGGPWLTCANTT